MRRLDGWTAFMMSLVGLGFLYVSRMRLTVILMVAGLALIALFSWTRWILEPVGIYSLVAIAIPMASLSLFYPPYIAWKQKLADTKFYNRWYFYLGWFVATSLIFQLLFVHLRPHLFGYEFFRTPARSMAPTLERGDWFTVDTWRYKHHEPQFGELVVFRTDEGLAFVQRLAGLPNDRIEIRGGVLFRNGKPTHEPYVFRTAADEPHLRDVPSTQLGPAQYYVLGDYRDQSRDSRMFGPVSRSQIVGRVEYIVFSFWSGDIQRERFPKKLIDDT